VEPETISEQRSIEKEQPAEASGETSERARAPDDFGEDVQIAKYKAQLSKAKTQVATMEAKSLLPEYAKSRKDFLGYKSTMDGFIKLADFALNQPKKDIGKIVDALDSVRHAMSTLRSTLVPSDPEAEREQEEARRAEYEERLSKARQEIIDLDVQSGEYETLSLKYPQYKALTEGLAGQVDEALQRGDLTAAFQKLHQLDGAIAALSELLESSETSSETGSVSDSDISSDMSSEVGSLVDSDDENEQDSEGESDRESDKD